MAYKQLLYPYKWNSIASPIRFRFGPETGAFESVNNINGRAQFVLNTITQDFQEGAFMCVRDTTNYDGTYKILKLEYDGVNNLILTDGSYSISESGNINSYSAPLCILDGVDVDGNPYRIATIKPDFYVAGEYFEFEVQGYLASTFRTVANVPVTDAELRTVLWDSANLVFDYEFGNIFQFQSDQAIAPIYFVNSAISSDNLNAYFVGIVNQSADCPPLTPFDVNYGCGRSVKVTMNPTQDGLIFDNVTNGTFNYSTDKEGNIW